MGKKNESATNAVPSTEKKTRAKSVITFRLQYQQDEQWFTVGNTDFPVFELDSLNDAKIVKSIIQEQQSDLYPEGTAFRVLKLISKSPDAIGL